jgi:hypothetical protein
MLPPTPSDATTPVRFERSRDLSRAQSRETRRWNLRLARYHHLAERAEEAAKTGWFRTANDRFTRESDAADEATREAAFTRLTEAEDLYHDRHTAPVHEAATRLAATPAPDLPALLAKIRLIQTHALHEDGAMERPALDLLAEDVERLAARPIPLTMGAP